jgi:hypothetical protein
VSTEEVVPSAEKAVKAKRNLTILGIAIAIILLIAAYLGFRQEQEKANAPDVNAVGACWFLDGESNFNPIECSNPLALFVTTDVVKAASECDDIYLKSDHPGEWLCVDLKIKQK